MAKRADCGSAAIVPTSTKLLDPSDHPTDTTGVEPSLFDYRVLARMCRTPSPANRAKVSSHRPSQPAGKGTGGG